jgi:hypothetical protein
MPLAPECPQNSEKSMDFLNLEGKTKRNFVQLLKEKGTPIKLTFRT